MGGSRAFLSTFLLYRFVSFVQSPCRERGRPLANPERSEGPQASSCIS